MSGFASPPRSGNGGCLLGERILVASIRSGKYPMKSCRKVGTEVVDVLALE
jgi:hypothetical protein